MQKKVRHNTFNVSPERFCLYFLIISQGGANTFFCTLVKSFSPALYLHPVANPENDHFLKTAGRLIWQNTQVNTQKHLNNTMNSSLLFFHIFRAMSCRHYERFIHTCLVTVLKPTWWHIYSPSLSCTHLKDPLTSTIIQSGDKFKVDKATVCCGMNGKSMAKQE